MSLCEGERTLNQLLAGNEKARMNPPGIEHLWVASDLRLLIRCAAVATRAREDECEQTTCGRGLKKKPRLGAPTSPWPRRLKRC